MRSRTPHGVVAEGREPTVGEPSPDTDPDRWSGGLSWRWRLSRALIRGLAGVTPKRNSFVVSSFPDFDDMTRSLVNEACRTGIRAAILTNSDATSPKWLTGKNVTIVRTKSPRGLFEYCRSRWVFYTHGLYLSPTPARGHVVVNLWHGMPIKKLGLDANEVFIPHFSYVLATRQEFVPILTRSFGVELDQVLVGRSPRVDVLIKSRREHSRAARPTLGIFPTYRASARGVIRVDGDPSAEVPSAEVIDELASALAEKGWHAIVKPHPMSDLQLSEKWRRDNINVVTDADLAAADETLYELIGQMDMLATDYSSIAIDVKDVNMPVIFVTEDLEVYSETRGLNLTRGELSEYGVPLATWSEAIAYLRHYEAGRRAEVAGNSATASAALFQQLGMVKKRPDPYSRRI